MVMASGASVRFGENKLLASFLGRPLICHTLEKIPRTLEKIVVVTRDCDVAKLAREAGLSPLLHTLPDIADTIRLGLQGMEEMDGCMFCVGDQPLCAAETMRRLIDAFGKNPGGIARASFHGQDGNPALFAGVFFEELRTLAPGQSGGTVIQRHAEKVIRVEADYAWELMDADTPKALVELEQWAGEKIQ